MHVEGVCVKYRCVVYVLCVVCQGRCFRYAVFGMCVVMLLCVLYMQTECSVCVVILCVCVCVCMISLVWCSVVCECICFVCDVCGVCLELLRYKGFCLF